MMNSLWRAGSRHIVTQLNKYIAPVTSVQLVITGQHRNMATKIDMSQRLRGTEKNIWVEFGQLARETGALNLGQGFPDFKPPQHVVDNMMTALNSDNYLMAQYTRSYGHPRLVEALSKVYSPLVNHKIDPMKEVTVSVGAYGALFCAVQGLVNPGDEVIIVEPYFDCYEPMVKVAGGTPKFCPIRPDESKKGSVLSSADWKINPDELAGMFNNKTKAIVINNPNNPIGKVFTREELQMVADLCIKHDVVCISDEVYEWMIYDDNKHIKIASLPGMWERTVTLGSAGKTYSATGWKLGWGIGPQRLIFPMQVLHQNCIYTCPTPIQEAVAMGLEYDLSKWDNPDECYFFSLAKELLPKRDNLVKICTELGMCPTIPEGGYFMMVDISGLNVNIPDDGTDDPYDYKFVRWMCKEKKLAAIPPSAFYSQEHKKLGEKFIRFCFIKKDETLDAAEKILREWKQSLSQ